MRTYNANVPNYTQEFVSNEMWTAWAKAYWVEVGVTIGKACGGYYGNPYYCVTAGPRQPFVSVASETYSGYKEYDYLELQPAVGDAMALQCDAKGEGSGYVWWCYFDNIGPWGSNGYMPSRLADNLATGLEMTENGIWNYGETSEPLWQDETGKWHFPWSYAPYANAAYRYIEGPHGNPPTCAAAAGPSDVPGTVYFTSWRKIEGSCWQPGHAPVAPRGGSPAGPPGEALTEALPESPPIPSSGPPPLPTGTASPVAPYSARSGPTLDSTQLREIALHAASRAQEPNPSEIRAVELPRATAFHALDGVTPTSPSGALASWLATSSYVIEMHGNFTLNDVSRPASDTPAPAGHVYSIVVDAHTGQVLARSLTDAPSASLASFGVVEPL
jgi:hypothetical protein